MFEFLKNDGRIKNKVKLVSIHIPKTAGTSFRNTLREVYGAEQVKRLDLDGFRFHLEQEPISFKKLPGEISVIHGHIHYNMLMDRFRISKNAQFITWLRDPVERVISNYSYLSKRLAEELDEERKGLNILSKMQRSLLEYAHEELNRNIMSKFLDGTKLEDFAFVGITDYYSEDLADLGCLMGWSHVPEFKVNVTGKKELEISEHDKSIIRKLNSKDDALYTKAIMLRKERKGL